MRTRPILIGAILAAVVSASMTALPADAVAKPTVRTISIAQGPTSGGTVVTITGTNFTRVSAVKFGGGSKARTGTHLSVKSRTKLTITSPKHAAGRLNIRVTAAGGTSKIVTADEFLYVANPSVTAISPASSSIAGGKTVTLTGTNFVGVTAVTFVPLDPRIPARKGTKVSVKSTKKLTVTTPHQAVGWVNVRVTAVGGTSPTADANDFQYATPPSITSYSPTEGETTPDRTRVSFTGTGLDEVTEATVDGIRVYPGYLSSTKELSLYTPLHPAGPVTITLISPGGTVSVPFRYVDPPVITSSTPDSGPTTGGTVVTLNGTHLTGVTVTVGSTVVPFTQDPTTEQITLTMPAHKARSVPIFVTTSGGLDAAYFRYVDTP